MQKLDRLGWADSRLYDIGGERIEVRTTSIDFAEWVDHVLQAYRIPHDGDDEPYFSVVIDNGPSRAGGKRFHILYRRTSTVVRTLDVGTLARSFLGEIERLRLPFRDDAVFLDGAVALASGVPVLLPGYLVPLLGSQGRRAERLGVTLPGHTIVQVDAAGVVVPLEPSLDVADDALARLAGTFPTGPVNDRFLIDEPIRVEAILQLAHAQGVDFRPSTRGATLHRLGSLTMNLPVVGGRALGALASLVDATPCFETTWAGEHRMLEVLGGDLAASVSSAYTVGRREDTPVAP